MSSAGHLPGSSYKVPTPLMGDSPPPLPLCRLAAAVCRISSSGTYPLTVPFVAVLSPCKHIAPASWGVPTTRSGLCTEFLGPGHFPSFGAWSGDVV